MTPEEFAIDIRAGIPDVLPEPMPYDRGINHAPKRKDILTPEEKKLALRSPNIMPRSSTSSATSLSSTAASTCTACVPAMP